MKFAFIYQESLEKEHFMYALWYSYEGKVKKKNSKSLADVKVLWGNYFCMKAKEKEGVKACSLVGFIWKLKWIYLNQL